MALLEPWKYIKYPPITEILILSSHPWLNKSSHFSSKSVNWYTFKMAWPTETIIALITLLVACLPLLIKAWFYVKRKLRRRTIGTGGSTVYLIEFYTSKINCNHIPDLLPLHRPPSYLAPRTLNENDTEIPGLLINLNQLERSIDMQIVCLTFHPCYRLVFKLTLAVNSSCRKTIHFPPPASLHLITV
jgi:hypothetical protein